MLIRIYPYDLQGDVLKLHGSEACLEPHWINDYVYEIPGMDIFIVGPHRNGALPYPKWISETPALYDLANFLRSKVKVVECVEEYVRGKKTRERIRFPDFNVTMTIGQCSYYNPEFSRYLVIPENNRLGITPYVMLLERHFPVWLLHKNEPLDTYLENSAAELRPFGESLYVRPVNLFIAKRDLPLDAELSALGPSLVLGIAERETFLIKDLGTSNTLIYQSRSK